MRKSVIIDRCPACTSLGAAQILDCKAFTPFIRAMSIMIYIYLFISISILYIMIC